MNNRRNNYNNENRNGDQRPPTDAPEFKEENGQRYQKVNVNFGPGYTYIPVADAPLQMPSTALRMEDRVRAAFATPQASIEQAPDIQTPSVDEVETLQRALRAHQGLGQTLEQRITELQEARAREEASVQEALDQDALRRFIANGGAIEGLPVSSSLANVVSDGPLTQIEGAVAYDKQPRARMSRKARARILVASGVLVAGAGTAATIVPNDLTAAFLAPNNTKSNDEVKEILPLPTAALVDSFVGCLDDNGAGPSLIELPVTSQIEVGYSYTGSKNTPKVLETSFYDENDKLVKANAKPVIITANAPTKVAACIPEADRAAAVIAEGSKVTVDMSKVATQLYQDVNVKEIARGFADSDTVADPMTELWPVSEIIENNVEASKARPDTEEKMTPAIAESILKNYNDNNNIVAEIRQAQEKTAQALIRPGGGYAEKIKAFLKERIIEKIKAKAAELKAKGLTGIENPEVVFVAEAQNIVEKNPETPKADSFKLADTVQITAFPDQLAKPTTEASK